MTSYWWDCIIIGGGPAGLTAAIYLARFRRSCLILDEGLSRAKLIKLSHNYPGASNGISGHKLLEKYKQQLAHYPVSIRKTRVVKIELAKTHCFLVSTSRKTYLSKNVILATGVIDIEPNLPHLKNAIKCGLIRHCAICDAYEIIDKDIAILGEGKKAINQALFLYNYTRNITVFNYGDRKFRNEDKNLLLKLKIKFVEEPIIKVKTVKSKVTTLSTAKNIYHFDTVYSALGAIVRSDLVKKLGVKHDIEGYIRVNQDQETSQTGLYAIGDVVSGLNQICVATGQAAIAAVAINKKLNNISKVIAKKT